MLIKAREDFHWALDNGPYAWPGGYPCYFVMADGEALSFQAAKDNQREILSAFETGDRDWLPVAFEINWEDRDLYCAHTGNLIEVAYVD